MTAPVTEGQVVAGKYLAALTFYALPLAADARSTRRSSPTTSEVDWGPVAAGYLGILRHRRAVPGGRHLRLGDDHEPARGGDRHLRPADPALHLRRCSRTWSTTTLRSRRFGYLNLCEHMDDFAKGIVDTRRLVFYAVGTAVLPLPDQPRARRQEVEVSAMRRPLADAESDGPGSRRGWSRPGPCRRGVLLVAALLVIVNYFGWKYHKRFDWTRSQLYSLSEKSKNVLDGLDADVEVVVFLAARRASSTSRSRSSSPRYEAASPRVNGADGRPGKNPVEAQQLRRRSTACEPPAWWSLRRRQRPAGDRQRRPRRLRLLGACRSGGAPEMTGFKGEQLFTSAILAAGRGAGSRRSSSPPATARPRSTTRAARPLAARRELLGATTSSSRSGPRSGKAAVPEGTDLLVIAGPTGELRRSRSSTMLARYLAERRPHAGAARSGARPGGGAGLRPDRPRAVARRLRRQARATTSSSIPPTRCRSSAPRRSSPRATASHPDHRGAPAGQRAGALLAGAIRGPATDGGRAHRDAARATVAGRVGRDRSRPPGESCQGRRRRRLAGGARRRRRPRAGRSGGERANDGSLTVLDDETVTERG